MIIKTLHITVVIKKLHITVVIKTLHITVVIKTLHITVVVLCGNLYITLIVLCYDMVHSFMYLQYVVPSLWEYYSIHLPAKCFMALFCTSSSNPGKSHSLIYYRHITYNTNICTLNRVYNTYRTRSSIVDTI